MPKTVKRLNRLLKAQAKFKTAMGLSLAGVVELAHMRAKRYLIGLIKRWRPLINVYWIVLP